MITGTVPVKVPEKLSELELDAGGKRIDNLGLGDTPDDVMRRSEKTEDYEVYGLLLTGADAAKPVAGIIDRWYFATDTLILYWDNGTSWVEVARGETAIRLAQLAERAHSSLTGIGASDHHDKTTLFTALTDRWTLAQAHRGADGKIMVFKGSAADPVEEDKYTDAKVQAIIAAKLKASSVTDTTGADGKVSVTFAEAFASTPIVTVQLENDVDYYCVVTAKSTTGFTVKILKTAHAHSQGNTGAEASHTHGISLTSGAGSSHKHSQGITGGPSTTFTTYKHVFMTGDIYVAIEHGGSPTYCITRVPRSADIRATADYNHTHTNPDTGYESSHTHAVSGTSGAGSSHSHSNPNTDSANAGNTLASTEVTFSYIAMVP